MLATLTKSGRTAIAKAIAAQPMFFGWGSGAAAWDEDPDKQHLKEIMVEAETLVNELGRRTVNLVGFVSPDEEGDITIPIGRDSRGEIETARYRTSDRPTPYLYLRVNFDFADANNQIIREVGVFIDAKVKDDLPAGQRYFIPDELEEPGYLLAVQRLDPVITRSPAVRQTFEFVLPI